MRNVISVSNSVLATMHSHTLPLPASLSKTNSKSKTSDTNTHQQFHNSSYLLSFNFPSINDHPHFLSPCNANFNFPRSSRSRLPTYVNAVQRCSSPITQSHSENGLAALSSSHLYKNYKGVSSSGSSETFADKLNEGDLIAAVALNSFDSLLGILKFTLLFGIISIHYTYPALAVTASDYATGFSFLPFLGDLSDISTSFASAFLLIFFSELGDKTFFIAALLAARNSAAVVFTGTFGALAAMTIISVVLGRTFHYIDEILPFRFGESDIPVDDIAAVCLLVYFGISTLLDATSSDNLKVDDEQKEAELAVSEFSGNGSGVVAAANTLISTFLLVFVAEWGDKSFFSTIALAAASSPVGVIAGALAGHGVATLLAVLGGSLLGTFLSEKVIAYIGGVLFLVFAVVTLVEILT